MTRYVLCVLSGVFFLVGCTLISPMQEVSIRTPTVPEDLESLYRGIWTLEYCSFSGDLSSRELDWREGIPDSLSLSRKKEEDLLILFSSPFPFSGQGFFPAGLWLPSDTEGGRASFHNGAAVFLVSKLAQGGVSMKSFNMERFLQEMGELDNPWNCDRELLLRQLARQEMCSWYVHEMQSLSVTLTFPAGCWYQANPEAPPIHSDGTKQEFELAEGYHFFYCPSRNASAEVQVDDHGEAVVIINSHSSAGSSKTIP